MSTIPKTVSTAISTSVSVMLASLDIPQTKVDTALAAFFNELTGAGTRTITNTEPLDRCLSRKQAAEVLGRSKTVISRMVKDGALRGIYGGRNGLRLTGISENSIRTLLGNGRPA